MGDFTIAYDTMTTASFGSEFNTAFDLWFTSDNPPTADGVTAEVMIWVNRHNRNTYVRTTQVAIDGQHYGFGADQKEWSYLVFVKATQAQAGSVHLKPFMDFLVRNGYVSSGDFLADIEFGTELVHGSGLTTIANYSIAAGSSTPGPTSTPIHGVP